MQYYNNTAINYRHALVCCTWVEVNRNAFETITKGMYFGNVVHRVYNIDQSGEPHRAILRDLDGTLSGTGVYSEVLGTSPTRRADPMCVTTPGLGKGAIACRHQRHRRVILGHNILGQGNQVKVTRRDLGVAGVADGWFGTGICQPPLGKWTLALAVGHEYMLQWSYGGDGGVLNAGEEAEQVVTILIPKIKVGVGLRLGSG